MARNNWMQLSPAAGFPAAYPDAAVRSNAANWTGMLGAITCAFVLLLSVGLAQPMLEMGINDDWSYVWIARDLAQTGHIHYNGWASSIMGWQLYWAALFFKIYGFSFAVARISVLCVAMGCTILLERILVRLGLRQTNAILGTLAFVLSPLFLPLAFSFMTDVPGLFGFLVCLYAVLRALQSTSTVTAFGWLLFAAASNVGLGTVRQISWLGALVLVPTAAWMLRRIRYMLPFAVLLWAASAAAIAGFLHWFHQAPYTLDEALLPGGQNAHRALGTVLTAIRSGLALALLLLPVLLGYLVSMPRCWQRARTFLFRVGLAAAIPLAVLIPVAIFCSLHHLSLRWLTPFSNNIVTARGLVDLPDLLGHRPDVVPVTVRIVLLCLIAASITACVLWLARSNWLDRTTYASAVSGLSLRTLFTLGGPYVFFYLLLLITRANLFDRYLLPCLLLALIVLLRLHQDCVRDRLPSFSIAAIALTGCFSIACMHDLYAQGRARLDAADALQRAGVPRSEFRAGFEYDSWTELELNGYINDPRVHLPADAYHLAPLPTTSENCTFWFSSETPHLHPRYGLAYEPEPCHRANDFDPVEYSTWLPPHNRAIYVQQLQ